MEEATVEEDTVEAPMEIMEADLLMEVMGDIIIIVMVVAMAVAMVVPMALLTALPMVGMEIAMD
jgi:hypothetical protein